jgi:hypothetical protein
LGLGWGQKRAGQYQKDVITAGKCLAGGGLSLQALLITFAADFRLFLNISALFE